MSKKHGNYVYNDNVLKYYDEFEILKMECELNAAKERHGFHKTFYHDGSLHSLARYKNDFKEPLELTCFEFYCILQLFTKRDMWYIKLPLGIKSLEEFITLEKASRKLKHLIRVI